MTRSAARRGFTLVELVVVIAIIGFLAGLAMLIVPGALDKDRAGNAATQLTGAMQISRARAARDGLPRGVRLVYNPNNNAGIVTEYQYIESPPAFVPNPGGPVGVTPYAANAAPFVQFDYTTSGGAGAGSVTNRLCRIFGLNADHQSQVTIGSILYLPTLGTYHRILNVSGTSPMALTIDQFPDGPLGAQTSWRTYHFGFYGIPRVLLGEETYQLPQYTCVDLNLSSPVGGGTDYDILFGPNGTLMNTAGNPNTGASGQVFLWVRDPSKPMSSPTPTLQQLQQGGEQLVVVVKAKSGALGVAPVDWAVASGGDPFSLARKAVSGQ